LLRVGNPTPRSQQQVVNHYRQLYADRDLGPLTVVEEVDDAGMPTGRMLLADGNHRYDPKVGYIPDPLFDNLPGAASFSSPAPQRHGRAKHGSDKRRK
jgi:hypothetical protein